MNDDYTAILLQLPQNLLFKTVKQSGRRYLYPQYVRTAVDSKLSAKEINEIMHGNTGNYIVWVITQENMTGKKVDIQYRVPGARFQIKNKNHTITNKFKFINELPEVYKCGCSFPNPQ